MAKKINILECVTLYDDCDINYTEMYDDFREWCEINDIDHTKFDEYSNYFHEWVGDTLSIEWEDMVDNIKRSDYNDMCVVVGTLGLWNGCPDITPTRFNDLVSAINKCVGNTDMAIIKLTNGYIDVTAFHHDSKNHFQIHCLNTLGRQTEGADLYKDCYYKKIRGWFE